METNPIILRGDTTVRDINDDPITIAELESKTNIIVGISIRSLENGEKQLRRTPIKIKVQSPINKNFYGNITPIDAFEVIGEHCSLAVGVNGDHRFYNGDGDFLITSLKSDEVGVMVTDDFTIYREVGDNRRQPGRLFKEQVEIAKIKEARRYYKVTFDLVADLGHMSGDSINVLISDHFLLRRWGKN